MGLESPTHIADLNQLWPLDADNVSQGDNHLRIIKEVLKTDFANINAAVSATPTQLDYTVVAVLGTVEASKAVTADASGNIDFNNGGMANVDIDSGSIDGATIGAATPAAITGTNITVAAGATVTEFSTDGTLAGNSAVHVPTESAVKTYVDAQATWTYLDTFNTTGGSAKELGENTSIPSGTIGLRLLFRSVDYSRS